jgi:SAM-dependent methyltransferase
MFGPRMSIDPEREREELSLYLGERFDLSRLQRYQRTLAEEFDSCGDEGRFYRTSEGYLYNLTAFAMTGTKLPYIRELMRLVPPGARLLDYGCGIGSDGLMLLEAGYGVEFADFNNPSVAYLRWRLEQRGLEAPIHDLDQGVPHGFNAAYAFDVIEHVPDPHAFLAEMERRSRLVLVNLLEPESDDQDIHHELPIQAILEHAASRRVAFYRVYHGRSHLLAYTSQPGGSLPRLAGRARLAAGTLRRRIRLRPAT